MASFRNGLRRLSEERKEWAGMPMPLDGLEMTIEPTYPYAKAFMADATKKNAAADVENEALGVNLRNTFWSWKWMCDIFVWEEAGKICWGPNTSANAIFFQLNTLGASDAWGIEQESNAVQTLGSLLKHRQFKQYMLTGMFMEKSERSGVHYLFRRLRPTLVISGHDSEMEVLDHRTTRNPCMRVLAALCLHPIGYYSDSWAGAMCPTDEVIAHLTLMRGDEKLYWRRANQHAPQRKEAGL